jgi:hypothetical protein
MAPGVITIVILGAILTAGFVSLARIVTDNQTRRRLSENGMSAAEIGMLLQQTPPLGFGALRAALILVPTGTALMVSQYLPFGPRDPFLYGLIAVASGIGLLIYQLVLPAVRRRLRDASPPGSDA